MYEGGHDVPRTELIKEIAALAGQVSRTGAVMRMLMTIVGVLLVLMGGVWILQGINVLPGSFMTGQTKWAVYGALAAVAGIVLIVLGRRGAR